MTSDESAPPARRWPAWALTAARAGLWTGLALLNETTTYHLAPTLVAVTPALATRARRAAPLAPEPAVAANAGGLLTVGAVLAALVSADALRGPSLVPGTGPLGENVIAALVGATYGLAVLRRRRPPWFLAQASDAGSETPPGIPD